MKTLFTPAFWYQWRLSQDKVNTLHLIFSCLLALIPFIQQSPWWVSLAAGLLLFWRSEITIAGHQLPSKWLLISITCLITTGILWSAQNWMGRETGVSILVILTCVKLLEMQARRDAMAVIFVSYFLLAGQLFYSQGLLTGLYLGLCLACLFSVQQSFHYHQLTPPFLQRLRDGASLLGVTIPLALLLFLLFPRIQGPLWGKPQPHPYGMTGLSDYMQPGNISELFFSDQIAFRVKFSGATPLPQDSYWRAIVLDRFDGQRWIASPSQNNIRLNMDTRPASIAIPDIFQHIIMEPNNQHWLFALDLPISITNPDQLTLHLTQRREIYSYRQLQERLQYDVVSRSSALISQQLTALERKNTLQLPPNANPLTMQWVNNLRKTRTDPTELAQYVLNYFRVEPFSYSLSPPPLGNQQVDDFMFTTRSGFCEHYASAFVVIMRALGIPARVVTGYQGGELNPVDGLTTIRQSDAHAWTEIWLENRGWLRIDPTAAIAPNRVQHEVTQHYAAGGFSRLINLNEHAWLRKQAFYIRANWDALNSAWNLWGLNYNWEKQKAFISMFGVHDPQLAQLPVILALSASIVTGLLALILLWKQTKSTPLDKLYGQFCKRMRTYGHPRHPEEGPSDYSHRLQQECSISPHFIAFLQLYSRCKYGKEYNSNNYNALKQLLKKCHQHKTAR